MRLALVVLLSLLAARALVAPDGGLRLQIDASNAALGHVAAGRARLVLSLENPSDRLQVADIQLAADLGREFKQLAGVHSVRSVATAELPVAENEEIELLPLLQRIERAPTRAREWIDQLARDPLVRGRLVSEDGRALLVLIELREASEAQVVAAAREVERAAQARLSGQQDLRWLISGAPLISHAISALLLDQLGRILPLAILICALVLLIAYRSPVVVLASLGSIICAVFWTLGLSAALGWQLNLVTILIPPLVTTLTVAYAMHVVAAFSDCGEINAGMARVRTPLIVTALTTMIGLAALAVNPLVSIRQFALLGAAGALASALSAMTFLPLILAQMQRPPQLWPRLDAVLLRGGAAIGRYSVEHSRGLTWVGMGIFALALAGASQVESGARYVRDLAPTHPARQAFETLNQQFSGANSFSLKISGAGEDVILNPRVLLALDHLQHWLNQQPEVGGSLSLLDYLKRLNQVFADDAPEAFVLPTDQATAKQLLVIAAPPEAARYSDLMYSQMLIEVSTPEVDTARLRGLFERLQLVLSTLPPGLEVQLGGPAVELGQTVTALTGGQLRSIAIAAGAIFLVLSLLFASWRVGLRAMLPNLLPIAVYFGTLGVLGIPLGPTTALVACIVLGIAVDDTLHLLVRFNDLARQLANEEQAAQAAVKEVIRPITLTTIAVSSGFLILTASPFHSQVVFGALAASTLLVAWFSDLLLTPAISARASIVTLWDVLRLDLGAAPQKTIPLMSGMSPRQARVLALHAEIRKLAAGENLITQGDEGHELYVVIDGRLEIWITRREGEPLVLAKYGRGATIGEGGLFNSRRTASVTAISPVRVMVFSPESLERIRRRNARLSALVYRNLNWIQAQRMAASTRRLGEEVKAPPPPTLRLSLG